MEQEVTEIRIYVACLASYNNGILHGRWIDATLGVDNVWNQVKAMLKASPIKNAEEYAIHDYEGFKGIFINEYDGIERAVFIAEFIEEHGELGAKLFDHLGYFEDAEEYLKNNYLGEYESLADYVRQMTEETSDIPDHLAFYIDYEKMADDMGINDFLTIETGFQQVHVFWRS